MWANCRSDGDCMHIPTEGGYAGYSDWFSVRFQLCSIQWLKLQFFFFLFVRVETVKTPGSIRQKRDARRVRAKTPLIISPLSSIPHQLYQLTSTLHNYPTRIHVCYVHVVLSKYHTTLSHLPYLHLHLHLHDYASLLPPTRRRRPQGKQQWRTSRNPEFCTSDQARRHSYPVYETRSCQRQEHSSNNNNSGHACPFPSRLAEQEAEVDGVGECGRED